MIIRVCILLSCSQPWMSIIARLMMSAAEPCMGALRQIETAAEYGLHVTLLPGLLSGVVHEPLHAGVAFEVAIHIGLRRPPFDTQLSGQAKGRHAVDEPEVDDMP